MKITMFHNKSPVATPINIDVESHIEHILSGSRPSSLSEPTQHLTFDAPRSMAPALCIAACEAVGGQREQAIGTASALHRMHVSAFTHDGSSPFGYELLTRLDERNRTNPSHILKVIMEISGAMGPNGMVEGQYEEMLGYDADRVCKKKEGRLYACAAACGAILGGASCEEIEALRRFGHYIGMIHGMILHGTGTKDVIEVFKCLSLKQLDDLQVRNIETIRRFTDRCFSVLGI